MQNIEGKLQFSDYILGIYADLHKLRLIVILALEKLIVFTGLQHVKFILFCVNFQVFNNLTGIYLGSFNSIVIPISMPGYCNIYFI